MIPQLGALTIGLVAQLLPDPGLIFLELFHLRFELFANAVPFLGAGILELLFQRTLLGHEGFPVPFELLQLGLHFGRRSWPVVLRTRTGLRSIGAGTVLSHGRGHQDSQDSSQCDRCFCFHRFCLMLLLLLSGFTTRS